MRRCDLRPYRVQLSELVAILKRTEEDLLHSIFGLCGCPYYAKGVSVHQRRVFLYQQSYIPLASHGLGGQLSQLLERRPVDRRPEGWPASSRIPLAMAMSSDESSSLYLRALRVGVCAQMCDLPWKRACSEVRRSRPIRALTRKDHCSTPTITLKRVKAHQKRHPGQAES